MFKEKQTLSPKIDFKETKCLLHYILVCFLIISSFSSKSQTNYFQKTIGGGNDDEGHAVQQTTDGGFISMGFTQSYGAGNSDFYLVKTSVNGNVLWTKMFGGTNEEECYSGQQTADGGYIMTGYTKSFGAGQEDVFLVKTDNLGNLQWAKRYGGTNDERGYYVEQTSDLGYIITGYTKSGFSAGAEDIYLIKTDGSGNLQWANAYGGNNEEFGYSVHQTTSGMYIVTGETQSFGAGQEDVFLLKTNGAGTLIYFKTFGGANQDFGYSIRQLSNGKYLIGGSTRSFGAGGDDVFLINTDTLGLLQFAKTYGGGNNDYAYELRETSTGQFIIAGLERSFGGGADDGYLIKTNNTGGLIWSKSYGGGNNEQINSLYQMSNGQFALLGHTRTFGVGGDDFYLLRADTAGRTGCNETNPATIVNTPAIVTGNFTPIVSPGGVVNTPAVIVTSNFDLTTLLCQCIAPPNITGNATICPGMSSTLSASGGTAYTWNTSATTSVIVVSPTITTTYSVIVSNGICSDTASFKVTVSPPPVISIIPASATICAGSPVLLTASGATTYSWIPASGLSCTSCSSPTASPVSNTVYTVTGTNINGCTNTQTVAITTQTLPIISISPASASICPGGSTVLTVSGANSYTWSPFSSLSCVNCSNPTANPTVTTTYTVNGTSLNGCTNSNTVTVTLLPVLVITPASATICTGSSTVITASGASTYTWFPSTALSCTTCASPTANPTITSTYTVAGTLSGCTNSTTVSVIVNPLPSVTATPSSTICAGGSVLLTASGGTSYVWSPATALSCTNCSGPTANPNSSTIYTVTGTDANGCSNSGTVSITVNALPVISVNPPAPVFCIGNSTVLTASGAVNYGWSPATALSCNNCSNPVANPTTTTIYTVTGTDVNGCINTKTVNVTVNPLPIISLGPASATFCAGGSTVFTASGANSYSWAPFTGLSCTNCPNPSANPTVSTIYTVTGTDLNGCSNINTTTITVNPLPVISINPGSATICTGGLVLLTASGANSYSWSPSSSLSCTNCSNPTANPTASTIYTVTGTSSNGCTDTQTISVTVNALPTITINPPGPVICRGGSVVLNASGAVSYGWSPATALTCNNCPSPTANPTITTTYTVTGTGGNGCTNTNTVMLTVNPLPTIAVSPSSVIYCGSGSTIFSASGANSYSWSPSTGLSCTNCSNPSTSPTVTTTYTITGIDLNGCSNTNTAMITVYPLPTVNVSPASATICTGNSASLTASGANNYIWSPSTALSCTNCPGPSATPTSNITYTVVGIDLNGCFNRQTVNITVNPSPIISISPSSASFCAGSSTVLSASGASSYSWIPVSGLSCTNCPSPVAGPSVSTVYTVTGTNSNGCTSARTATIIINPTITISPGSATICVGTSTVLSATGATSYTWAPTPGLSCYNCSGPTANPSVTTIFTVSGTAIGGCVNTQTVSVTVNPLPSLTISPASATLCIGSSTVLSASGANNYVWSPLNGLSCSNCTSPIANPTVTTTYTITGTGANGCVNKITTSVIVNPLPTINISPPSTTFCMGGSVFLTASGANNYVWLPSTALSCSNCASTNANPSVSTVYTVTGTNVNACSNTQTVSITVNPVPVVTISPASATLCVGASTALTASGANTYTWSPSSGLSCTNCPNPIASPTLSTTYTITGSNLNGCSTTNTISITVNAIPVITINPATSTICIGSTTTLSANGANTYFWAPTTGLSCISCANPAANPTVNTIYTVTGTSINGCVNTQTTSITINALPVVTANPTSATLCAGGSTVLSVSGANNYFWTPSAALSCTNCSSPVANPTVTTTYSVTGIDFNGCASTKTIAVIVNPFLTMNVNPTTSTMCIGDSTVLTVTGATNYTWSPASGLSCSTCSNTTASPNVTTNYTVSGNDINGCTGLTTVLVTINPLPVLNTTPSSATLCAGSYTVVNVTGANNYLWSPTTGLSCSACSNPTVNPSVSTIYTITGTDVNGCVNSKTLSVNTIPSPVITISPPTATFCVGSSTILNTSGANNYTWSPAAGLSCTNCASPVASPTITTTYTVNGTGANGCMDTKKCTITVGQKINGSIIGDSVLCFGSSINLAATGGGNYSWSNGSNSSSITISPATNITYSVIITNAGCADTVFKSITVYTVPIANAGPDVMINYGTSTTLQGSGGGIYSWNPFNTLSCSNCFNPVASPTLTTLYALTVTNELGCSNTDSMYVFLDFTCGEIFVPNAFSPNGDGQNDILYVENQCISFLEFVIYDRWGEKVFETNDPKTGWDGSYKGSPMNGGGFVYYLKARLVNHDDLIVKKGNILIAR